MVSISPEEHERSRLEIFRFSSELHRNKIRFYPEIIVEFKIIKDLTKENLVTREKDFHLKLHLCPVETISMKFNGSSMKSLPPVHPSPDKLTFSKN